MRVRNQLTIQINNLTVEVDSLSVRLEEEAESNIQLKLQLSNAQAELQRLRSKYDKDMMIKTEELEDIK